MVRLTSLVGVWLTPMPLEFVEEESNEGGKHVYRTDQFKAEVEKKEIDLGDIGGEREKKVVRHITLTLLQDEGVVMHGTANVKFDRICWENGAQWARHGATKRDRDNMRTDREANERPAARTAEVEIHGAPDDAALPGGWCSCFCGAKPPPAIDAPQAEPLLGDEPMPPSDADAPQEEEGIKGFFSDEQVEDIVDRINEVVGIWGISEETEREYIKPPVVSMNRWIKSALETFLDSTLVDLLQDLLDEGMDVMEKAKELAAYVHDRFIKPLAAALLDRVQENFNAISWIRNRLQQVVLVMSKMVANELLSKTVEQLQESDAVG